MNCSHWVPSHRLQIFRTHCSSVDTHRITGLAENLLHHGLLPMGLIPFCTGSPQSAPPRHIHLPGLPMGCSVGALHCRKGMCFPTGCRESLFWHLEYFLPSPSLTCVSAEFFPLPYFLTPLFHSCCAVFHPFLNLLSQRHHQDC